MPGKLSNTFPNTFPETFDHLPSFTSFANKSYFDVLSIEENEEETIMEESWGNEWNTVARRRKTRHSGSSASRTIRAKVEPTRDVGLVDYEGKSRLRKSGSGKITIDSGAGESVCPIDMVPDEPLHMTAKNDTKYRAVGGQSLIKKARK